MSLSANLCVYPTFPLDTCEKYLAFGFFAPHLCCCQERLSFFFRDSEVYVKPALSLILAHCHFDIALLPPRPASYALPAICILFAVLPLGVLLF